MEKVQTLSLKKSQSAILALNKPSRNIINTSLADVNKEAKTVLQENQRQAINVIIRELAHDTSGLQAVLKRAHIQHMFRQEFQLNDREIKDIELQIIKQCEGIVNRQSAKLFTESIDLKKKEYTYQVKQESDIQGNLIQQSKSQPLTLLQRKELEKQQTLEYFNFPAQPCVRSLYYLSKIAQSQSIKVIVPPTVLIGFGDDNRIIYNDQHNGKLVVESKNISPKRIQNFIQSHMINSPEQQSYSIEEKLLYPKFVIRLASKGSTSNEIKLYYSRESLIADLLNFWGSYDLVLQAFVKQKHPFRPCIYRCYINKNGNVYKAVSINNQENVTKESKFYQTLMTLIEETHQKNKRLNMLKPDAVLKSGMDILLDSQIPVILRPKTSIIQQMDRFLQRKQRNSISRLNDHLKNNISQASFVDSDLYKLDSRGFPVSLDAFKLTDYYTELQLSVPNSEFKKAFICTSDNIDNLTMMNCRPSALNQAQLMTMDLFRLFSQYYLKIQKFGNISQFVCDFMEDHNGLMYLLQVKSFECEGILYDWQVPFQPQKSLSTVMTSEQIREIEQEQHINDLYKKCEAHIICRESKLQPKLKEQFIQACKELDIWDFQNCCKKAPMFSERLIRKYQLEIELGKECFCLQSEKQRISPLFPLTSFCDNSKHSTLIANGVRGSIGRESVQKNSVQLQQSLQDNASNAEAGNEIQVTIHSPKGNELNTSRLESYRQKESEPMLNVCYVCQKVLELFTARYYALVFKTEQTVDELRRLKLRLINHWTYENILFLLKVYKDSKKSLYITSDIDKLEKRSQEQAVRDRAKSPDSVIRKKIKNLRRPESAYRADGFSKLDGSKQFDQLITIDSENNQSQSKDIFYRPKLLTSRSLLRSVDIFQRHVENIGGVPYDQSKIKGAILRAEAQSSLFNVERPMSGVLSSKLNSIEGGRNLKKGQSQTIFHSALSLTEQAPVCESPYQDQFINANLKSSIPSASVIKTGSTLQIQHIHHIPEEKPHN